jgi:hypothetical protein
MSATPFVAASSSSQKLRSFAQKFVKDPPKDKEGNAIPTPKNDIFERMDLGHKLSQDNSIDDTIDAFPDTRYPLKYIIYNVMKLYKTLDQERPLLSPSSFVAYCLFQLYAFALINDVYGRPHPSFPANQFMDADSRNDLLDAFCNSFVAPFMLTLFHALSNTSDPRRPGLQYFCTLAGSRFKTDFGRYIPAQIFIAAHNMSCEADTSRNVASAMAGLINTILFIDVHDNDDQIRVAHYLSAGVSDTTFYDSWLYEAVKTLFSPVTGKSLLRRTNIESIPLDPAHRCFDMHCNDADSNQYVLFTNSDKDNIYAMNDFISAFSNLIDSSFPTSVKLGSIPDSQSGTTILVHGYSSFALPTWHSREIKKDTELKLTTKLRTTKYAEETKFLQAITYKKSAKNSYPAVPGGMSPDLYLIRDVAHDPKKDPDHEITFDSEHNEFPRVLYLDPYTSGDGPVSLAMLSGMLIESFEVDGSSVPMPDSNIGLAPNNRQFLQGSLPLKFIHHGYKDSLHHDISPVNRSVAKSRVQKISHDLYDMAQNRLGYLDIDSADTSQVLRPIGFNLVEHIHSAFSMFSKLSFSTNALPDPQPASLDVWSPYRYVSSRSEEQPSETKTFMIFNFRTLYGTHIPLVSTRHPALVIPLS